MLLKWISKPTPAKSPLAPEEPVYVLAAPGSITPGQRLSQVLAASTLLAVAFRPLPRAAAAGPIAVTNNNSAGPGSLFQAVHDANTNPGPDTITFSPSVSGTISLTGTLNISDSVTIQGPGPGKLSVSGGNAFRVFYLYSPAHIPFTSTISGLTIRDGVGLGNGGGGILDFSSSLTLDLVNVLSNTTGSKGSGGGLDFDLSNNITASLTIRNSLISGNAAGKGGGIFLYEALAGVIITNTQIVSNTASGNGGGAYLYHPANLLIEDSAILSNTAAGNGGGIETGYASGGSQTIRRTIISGNSSQGQGGGAIFDNSRNILIEDSTVAGNSAHDGGGAYLRHLYGTSNFIRRTTISGNTAFRGGGVYMYHVSAPLSVENTTLSGNHATGKGGGAYILYASGITIRNSTIVSNTAMNSGGGVETLYEVLPINNTIIAGNVAPAGPDITGTLQLNYDLVEITGTATLTNSANNLFGLDPLLGPLADNGGPTKTHLPRQTSPAINHGDPAFAPPPATDQRGDPRVADGRLDIGAVEVKLNGQVQFTSSSYPVNENGITATVTVSRTGGSASAVSVDYATGGGTAIPGTDYQTASGTLHWADGDSAAKTFPITILDDNQLDGNATIGLTLSNPQGGATLGSPITATLTITDNVFNIDLPLILR